MSKKRKLPRIIKVLLMLILIGGIGGGVYFWNLYQRIYQPNVTLGGDAETFFFIPTGSDVAAVSQSLYEAGYIMDRASFEWVAEKKRYANRVNPGRYRLKAGMSNNELVNLLRSGEQVPVQLQFNNIRTQAELSGKIARQIEADSASIIALFKDPSFISKYGFNRHTILSMFVPNTYEVYWNTSAEDFFARMAREYKAFWSEERKAKANKIGLSQSEVASLASIVQKETYLAEERAIIAGVYMNRLRKGIPLQADPTLIWAIGDFTIKRVLNEHKEIDSPYNTYKYRGLPPGPICLPEISYLDAVLNYERHQYIYFCAKEDFSGYSNFAKSYSQHLVNARKYQQALNKRKIYR